MHVTFLSSFNAIHRLWNPALSETENEEVYGKCVNLSGHGHCYGLEVTVAAPVDGRRPVVIARAEVQRLIENVIKPRLHHGNMDQAFGVEGFISTGENVTREIWHLIQSEIASDATLVSVTVRETHKNSFTYRGGAKAPPIGAA